MTITLGGIALGIVGGDELALNGLRAPTIAVDSQRSEGGILHILTAPIDGGRELQLEGMITEGQADAILALSTAAVPVNLVHPRGNLSVLVLGLEAVPPGIDYTNPTAAFWLAATIQLLEV